MPFNGQSLAQVTSAQIFFIEKERGKVEKMAGIAQDWEPVVIRKKAPTAAARKDEKAVNAARRSGAEIETVKKCTSLLYI